MPEVMCVKKKNFLIAVLLFSCVFAAGYSAVQAQELFLRTDRNKAASDAQKKKALQNPAERRLFLENNSAKAPALPQGQTPISQLPEAAPYVHLPQTESPSDRLARARKQMDALMPCRAEDRKVIEDSKKEAAAFLPGRTVSRREAERLAREASKLEPEESVKKLAPYINASIRCRNVPELAGAYGQFTPEEMQKLQDEVIRNAAEAYDVEGGVIVPGLYDERTLDRGKKRR